MAGFVKATKQQAKLRIALTGPSGTGKTFTSLKVGSIIARATNKRLAVIDTEHGSAAKYADLFDFDAMELTSFDPRNYVAGIKAAEDSGYGVLVIDSLSHAWSGTGGALDMVDKAAARSQSHNSFAAWREVTPVQNQLIETILGADLHVIATMRVKTEYVIETQNGRQTPRKVGLAPVQRDQVEYEFDVVGDLDQNHTLVITKTRCTALDEAVLKLPGEDFAATLLAWLGQGEPRTVHDVVKARDGALVIPGEKKTNGPIDPMVTDRNDPLAKRYAEKRDQAATILPEQVIASLPMTLRSPVRQSVMQDAIDKIEAAIDLAQSAGVAAH